MQKRSSHENISYSGTVNVIGSDVYPKSFPLHWHNHVEIAFRTEEENSGVGTSPDRHTSSATDMDMSTGTGQDMRRDQRADAGTDHAVNPNHAVNPDHRPLLHINQTAYRMNPGDILFIWPGEMHEIVENGDSGLTGLQFSVALFDELPDFTPFFHFFRSFHQISCSEQPELAGRIMAHIRRMLSALESGDTFSGVRTVICLYEMFMDFGNYIKNMLPVEASPGTGGERKPFEKISTVRTFEKISAACGYIIDNCEHELTLESAAAYAGSSACYFSRIFKQFTNYNFVEYLALQRIKRAQRLLADPDKSVTEIAYQAGFKSISTFNRVFRQYRGCSPSEYRKYYLK